MLIYLQMIESEEDRDKFAKLYTKYKNMMFRIAMDFFHNEADAEDAVHQTFLKIIANLDKIGQVDCRKTRSYIAVITEHTSIDLLRKQKRHEEVPLDSLNDTLAAEETVVEDDLVYLIDGLKPVYREVLYLRYFDEYEEKEIAKLLGLSYSNVRKIVERAKHDLRELLERRK